MAIKFLVFCFSSDSPWNLRFALFIHLHSNNGNKPIPRVLQIRNLSTFFPPPSWVKLLFAWERRWLEAAGSRGGGQGVAWRLIGCCWKSLGWGREGEQEESGMKRQFVVTGVSFERPDWIRPEAGRNGCCLHWVFANFSPPPTIEVFGSGFFALFFFLMCPILFKLEEISTRSCPQSERKPKKKDQGHLTQFLAARETYF